MAKEQFLAALREQLVALGGKKVWRRIARAVHAAAFDPGGIAAERDAILERAAFAYQDWIRALAAPTAAWRAIWARCAATGLCQPAPPADHP
jgi:hypothetical protein